MSTQQAITERVPRTTPPLPAERLAALRDLIPEAFTEGRIDWEKLRAALGDLVDERPERYAFTWAGKRDAIRMLQAPSRATLVADREASVSFDTTEHVFIEGENLEVLKLLYKPYFGRVKMIYIDPPYNTGNDFVYPDNFADPLDSYLRLSGQRDAEGNLLTSNPETSGRYHSAWLSMMYPRLFLARQLLREDGVIFVSIDDHEVHNLRMLMNEVFGEENHYATIAWQKRDTPSNDAKGVSVNHEYVVVYRRSASFERNLIPRTDAQLLNYKNPDSDPRGPWIRTSLIRKQVRSGRIFPLTNPAGREVRPPPGTSWRVPQETFARLQVDNRLWWGLDGNGDLPFKKRFLSEVQEGTVPVSWWDYEYAGSNRNAKMELRALFERQAPFETPKPSSLVRRMLEIATTPTAEDIILDFFAGSATTAQAVLELNREDGGNRRFILVQLPEPTGREDYRTIAHIGRERIRRVLRKLEDEKHGEQLELEERSIEEDLGFRAFRLAGSHFRPWKEEELSGADAEAYAAQLEIMADPLLPGWTAEGVIREVALREGYGLNLRIERVAEVAEATVYRVTDPDRGQRFHITLDEQLTLEALRPLALGRDDLFVCRDAALDDEAAANLALQCRLRTL